MRSRSVVAILAVLASMPWAAGQVTPTLNDVQFATAPLDAGGTVPLRMDIYLPQGATSPVPAVLVIHGGGWQSGTYNQINGALTPLLQRGIALVSVEYRLSGQAIFPAQIHDVKAAVRFLRAHAVAYGINPRRIGAFGSSAGGHLASLLGTSHGSADLEGNIGGNVLRSSRVQAVADYFGPTDIININLDVTTPPGSTLNHDAAGSPESKLIGFAAPGEGIGVLRANLTNPNPPFPEKVALANLVNPVNFVERYDPPFIICHGDMDTTVPLKQSRRLVDALVAVGVPADFRIAPGMGHGFLGNDVNAAMVDWLAAQLLGRLEGDVNADGYVNVGDLQLLVAAWGSMVGEENFNPWADITVDDRVNVGDLQELVRNWGKP